MKTFFPEHQYENDFHMKPHAKADRELPAPLTWPAMKQVLQETHTGTQKAIESCLDCYKSNRMSASDVLAFLRSMMSQSVTLQKLFDEQRDSSRGELASADEMAELRALAGIAPAASFNSYVSKCPPPRQPVSSPAPAPVPAISFADPRVPKPSAARVRKPKVVEPSDAERELMRWWSEKRVPEVKRRQHETAGCNGYLSEGMKQASYVKYLFQQLRNKLPVEGKVKLLALLRVYMADKDAESFGEKVKSLVDEFDVKCLLSFAPEVTVRAPKRSTLPAVDMDEDAEPVSLPQPPKRPAPVEKPSMPAKRKRTETLHGADPREFLEEDDESAMCPVCRECPREDDRWVKCDGCGSWYHQICVLFNEAAHGKSVRFFCRTPGCRKKGSRQLNRRQRKPCYPTSPSIESCPLSDFLSSSVQSVSRQDRSVVVKVVASSETSREAKVRGKKVQERVRCKTICAFQHTLIGSDLLFLTMFVEEVRGSDGSGRVEVTHLDSNGLYEQMEAGEATRVESAIMEGYLRYARSLGFSSARLHLHAGADASQSLFFARGSGGWLTLDKAVAAATHMLTCAQSRGAIHSFLQESATSSSVVLRVLLGLTGGRVEDKEEKTGLVGMSRSEWVRLQEVNNYRFEELQFAKFSSMMLVYHIIKGVKRDLGFSSSLRPLPQLQQAVSEDALDLLPSVAFSPNEDTANMPVKQEADTEMYGSTGLEGWQEEGEEVRGESNVFESELLGSESFLEDMPVYGEHSEHVWDSFLF